MDYPKLDASAGLHNGKFTDGDHVNNIPASKDSAEYQNMVFDSLIALIVGAGLVPDETKTDLVFKAVKASSSIENASLIQAGLVQLSNSITSPSETKGATSKAVKDVNDALLQYITSVGEISNASLTESGITMLSNSVASNNEAQAATSKAVKIVNDALNQYIASVVVINNASITESGIVQLDNNLTSESQSTAATSLAVKLLNDSITPGIGTNQTWQSVTGSRSLNTIFTNTTGKPIMVAIYMNSNNTKNISTILVDGTIVSRFNNVDGAVVSNSLAAIVPDLSTYELDTASATLSNWSELR